MTDRREAAVLIAMSELDGGDEGVLLTLRSEHLSTHSGEVAFPGGMRDQGDPTLCHTALREAHEEVGLEPNRVNIVGQLPASKTYRNVAVTPFIGRVDSPLGLTPNQGELQSLFWLPMRFLLSDNRVRTDIFEWRGREVWSPVYHWKEFTIWGFTARVLVDFVNHCGIGEIKRDNAAPEIPYERPQIA